MNSSRVQFSFRVLWYVQLLMQTPPTVDSLGKRKKKKSNAQATQILNYLYHPMREW